MQAHPVPQNIMQVEFQLVGNLTLRQFGYIAIAGLLAWLIFVSPVLAFIKIPIAIAVGGLGLALAFLPINDMRLENWIIAFFKAIYAPTRRVWLKQEEDIEFLTDKFTRLVARPAMVHTRTNNRARLDLYLNTTRAQVKNKLDEFEERKLQSLNFQVEAPVQLAASPTLSPEALPIPEPIKESPRIVEETPKATTSIASKVIFTPVATIKLPDKNIFVKPLSNKRRHSLNPKTAHQGTILLPIRGERIFQVSQEIKEKLNKYVKPVPTPAPSRPQVLMKAESFTPAPPKPQYTPATLPHLATELKPEPPSVVVRPTPPPPTTSVERPIINVFLNPTAPTPTPIPAAAPPPPVEQKREDEKPQPKLEPISPPTFTTPVTPIPAQPTTATEVPPTPQHHVEENLEGVNNNESLRQNIKQLTTEESLLKGEVERYKAQEKYLEGQLSMNQKSNPTQDSAKLKELEDQLMRMQQDKEHAESRAQRLEGLINQLSTTQPKPAPTREIVTPQEAVFAPKAPEVKVVAPRRAEGKMAPPMTTVPNVINGVVKDTNGLLLTDTIIVVKDKNDEPVRALKTNRVGQFAISTALPNGTYLMEVEKEGYEFDYIEIKLNGEILAPIEIRARGGSANG